MGQNSTDRGPAPDLRVTLGPLKLANPVLTASGTFGYGLEFADFVDLSRLGGVVVKGISLKPRPGNPPPRIAETPSGMLNAIGLENVGVERFLSEKLPPLVKRGAVVIVNILGNTVEEYGELARILSDHAGIAALEINISCPNVKEGGIAFGTDPRAAAQVVAEVRKNTPLPLITKLSPNVTSIAQIAGAVVDAGSDILSCINTVSAMAVDPVSRRPKLANVMGGLSGPAVKPIALRCVYEVVRAVPCPVIGIGGIQTAWDALEFLVVGASAVQIGTANFVRPTASVEILDGMERFCREHGVAAITDYIGTLDTQCRFPFADESCPM